MVCVNHCYKESYLYKSVWTEFVKLLSIFAPHIAEELWQKMGYAPPVARALWPSYDEALIKEEQITIAIQINGKTRGSIVVAAENLGDEIVATARADEKIARHLARGTLTRTIYVKGRLVNFVVAT